MGLAHAHRADGNETHAILEFRAAHATFERIGAASQAARALQAIGESASRRHRRIDVTDASAWVSATRQIPRMSSGAKASTGRWSSGDTPHACEM